MREAIASGAWLVPVLAYGENDVYHVSTVDPESRLGYLTTLIKRHLGFAVPQFSGRTMFYKRGGLMPRRTPINVVVGKPLPPPTRDGTAPFRPEYDRAERSRPTNDDARILDAHHRAYINALEELYQSTKDALWNVPGRKRSESLKILK